MPTKWGQPEFEITEKLTANERLWLQHLYTHGQTSEFYLGGSDDMHAAIVTLWFRGLICIKFFRGIAHYSLTETAKVLKDEILDGNSTL